MTRAVSGQNSPLAASAGRIPGAAGPQRGGRGRESGAERGEGSCRTWSVAPSGGSLRRKPRSSGHCPSLPRLKKTDDAYVPSFIVAINST